MEIIIAFSIASITFSLFVFFFVMWAKGITNGGVCIFFIFVTLFFLIIGAKCIENKNKLSKPQYYELKHVYRKTPEGYVKDSVLVKINYDNLEKSK